jgi:hypothetical protein
MMPKNRFEQVDERQEDAITLSLWKQGEEDFGSVNIPAGVSGGRLVNDSLSDNLPIQDAFRAAIKVANEVKAPVVVVDPDGLWQAEWGTLYRYNEG